MAYEHDTGKVRTSSLLDIPVQQAVLVEAKKESRHFSPMVNILLKEALHARKMAKNGKK
jgi:hypothetical protein